MHRRIGNLVGRSVGGRSLRSPALGLALTTAACQSYAALGDSYTAGPLIPQQQSNPAGCLRSVHNYPHLVAPSLSGTVLRDAILPDTGTGCWPQMPVTPGDVPYLRAKEKQLNAMLATEAAGNGATYVDTYTPSIGHDACQLPTVRWVEPVVPNGPAAPVHPNAAGEQGMANAVLATIGSGS